MKALSLSLMAVTCISLLALAASLSAKKPVLYAGAKAPEFTLFDEQRNVVKLSTLLGKQIALCFYPKNNTVHCTKEMCSLRDGFAELTKNNITVLGINYATPSDNQQFKNTYLLPFTLLSDESKEVAKAYGAYGGVLRYFIPKRKTFLIDEKGIIIAIIDTVNLEQHARQIIDIFASRPVQ